VEKLTGFFSRGWVRCAVALSLSNLCFDAFAESDISSPQNSAAGAIPATVQGQNRSPLEGQVQDKAPLEGMVQDKAPLEGNVDQKTIEGHVEDRAPLDASVQGSGFNGKAETPAAARKPLEGRLEEVGKPSSTLPIELTNKIHKNQPFVFIMEQAQMAPVKPKLLTGGIAHLQADAKLPDFFVRTWGGHLKILERDVYEPDPADSHLVSKEDGVVVVRFVKRDDAVDVVPTAVFFQRRPVDKFHHMRRREAAFNPNEDLKPEIYYDYPVIALGDGHWQTNVGSTWQDQVLHNSLQMIGDNRAEEDVVFARSKDGKPYGFRETVVRFTWRSQNSIFMQVAVVDYEEDRSIRKSTKIEGTITPDWEPFAKEISGITLMSWPETTRVFHL
jgi:hypothetical protein